jgi:hypothetical protein
MKERKIPGGGRILIPENEEDMAELERRRKAGTLDPGLMHDASRPDPTRRPEAEDRLRP